MKTKIEMGFQYFFLTLASVLSVFPLYWMAVSATNSSVDVLRGAMLPGTSLMNNLNNLLANNDVAAAMRNSSANAAILTALALLVCSIAGYGFEIYHDKRKDFLMRILLLAMMIPFVAIMIPLYQMFSRMRLLSSLTAVILPTISTPFLIMMFRQSARSFPHEIIDAARIDGLSELQIFLRMYIPTNRSTYAAAMIIVFMTAWNNFMWPRVIILDAKKITMPLLVSNLTAGYVTDYGGLMLAVLLSTLPTIIIFFILQRHFAEGIAGSVKQ